MEFDFFELALDNRAKTENELYFFHLFYIISESVDILRHKNFVFFYDFDKKKLIIIHK